MAQGAKLGHVEPMRDEPEVDESDRDVEKDKAEGAADGDTVDAVVAEMGRNKTEGTVVLVGVAAEDEYADEEGLVYNEHEQCREEETGESACRVVEFNVVIDYRLDEIGGLLAGDAR